MISELPPEWMRAPIGSLCSLVNGRAFKPTEWTTKGVPIVRIQNLNNPEAPFNHYQGELDARHRLKGGELLFAWSGTPGTSFGAHIWHGQQAALNQHIFRVDFDGRLLDKRFFRFAINEKLNELIGVAQGGVGLRHVTKGVFESTEVAVPPRKEQTRIADQLDTLLARIQACNDRLDAIPALLKRFRQAALNAATSGSLTDECRNDETTPWRKVQLADVASDFSYGSAAKSAKTGKVPVLRMGNIQDGRLDWNDLVFTSDEREIDKYALTAGDVLFNRTNSPELVGKTAVYKGERPAVYAGYLIRVRCSPSLLPEYLNYCLGSQHGRSYCWSVKSDGVSQSNINAKKLAAFPFRLPSLSEQVEIVRRVEALMAIADRIEARCVLAAKQSQRLAPLTLAKAFRGELVQQDPTDEPASVLLQRLAKTTTVTVKASRGRPRSKQANQSVPLPAMHPDWAALPAGTWATSAQPDEHATAALLIAVLKAWGQPMPQDQARLAAMLCLQPRLFTAALPAHDATPWRRLVGAEAEPLPASVAALQPAVNTHWRRALAGLRARGDLVASGSRPQDTWSLGPGADRVDTAGWPDGRAGWVVAYLRAHGVEAVLPRLPTAAVDFVHAHAA